MRIGYGTSITVPTSTERWLSSVRSGKGFSGAGSRVADPANLSHVQLFNPVGSGKQLLVRSLLGNASAANQLSVTFYNVALATLLGNGANLLSGGAASAGEIRSAVNAATLGTTIGLFRIPAADGKLLGGDWICELSPGQGLCLVGGAVNIQVDSWLMWEEA